jgi:hypothetical protein
VVAAKKIGIDKKTVAARYPRVFDNPFNAQRKTASVVCDTQAPGTGAVAPLRM